MNQTRAINARNERELEFKASNRNSSDASWHDDYRDSNWIYCGQLNSGLTEGDLECVFSQYGTVEQVQLARHREGEKKGESKGFAFLEYQDFRSCILAVDNFNGISLAGRQIRIDHARPPRNSADSSRPKHRYDDDHEDPSRSRRSASPQSRESVDPYLKEKLEQPDLKQTREDLKLQIASELGLDEEDPMYDYLVEKEFKKRYP